jgi:hypothetical protein
MAKKASLQFVFVPGLQYRAMDRALKNEGDKSMELIQKMYDHFDKKAREIEVESVSIGLGYTAVTTSDGGIGIAYTYVNQSKMLDPRMLEERDGCRIGVARLYSPEFLSYRFFSISYRQFWYGEGR